MAKLELYCQNLDCCREISGNTNHLRGGVIVNKKLYCCYNHGNVEDTSRPFHNIKELKKEIRRGNLVEYGLLEKKAD